MNSRLLKLAQVQGVFRSRPMLGRRLHANPISGTQPSPSDPFPLPLSKLPNHQNDSDISEDMLPQPIPRYDEDMDTLRARLVYQSRKRGTLESDLLLSTFAKEHLANMDMAELKEFDKLMDEPDWDIYYWSIEKRQPPERWASSPLLAKLRAHTKNEGKVVRMMPELPRFDS